MKIKSKQIKIENEQEENRRHCEALPVSYLSPRPTIVNGLLKCLCQLLSVDRPLLSSRLIYFLDELINTLFDCRLTHFCIK